MITAKIKNCAVLLCAGSGSRMGGEQKLLRPIYEQTAILRSLKTFLQCPEIEHIAIVVSDQTQDHVWDCINQCNASARCSIVTGGSTRAHSVLAGLSFLHNAGYRGIVAIHDAARCLVRTKVVLECLDSARKFGSGVAGTSVVDSIKQLSPEGMVVKGIPRHMLWAAQTPQAFEIERIFACYISAQHVLDQMTDDAEVYMREGYQVHCVEGGKDNIKITYEDDIAKAEAMICNWENKSDPKDKHWVYPDFRIGYGEDVHRLEDGYPLILGGLHISHEKGLIGHSDADVLAHAVCDSLLGAAALGDIGWHFPDTDPQYKGADSMELLSQVWQMIQNKGFSFQNLDATIVAQRPKLSTFIPAMRKNLCDVLHTDLDKINIKATTSEMLGFEGREEGITVRVTTLLIYERYKIKN